MGSDHPEKIFVSAGVDAHLRLPGGACARRAALRPRAQAVALAGTRSARGANLLSVSEKMAQ
jgi:hypothetical protein